MKTLYPLKFYPLLKSKIWGGKKMKKVANIDFEPLPNCGEAWLISGIKGNESVVLEGWLEGNTLNEIIEIYMSDLLGDEAYTKYGEEFPLLIKLIDATEDLSIQVHPTQELAEKRGLENGKTEMWYIMESDKDSSLISGFKKEISKEEFKDLVLKNELESVLNYEPTKKGDVFYMPGGRVHSIGKGIFLAEIQQSSDTTYRIYDWNRKDDKGNGRKLHLEESLDAIDFKVSDNYRTEYELKKNETTPIVKSPFFITNTIQLTEAIKKDYSELDSFVVYLAVEGEVEIIYDEGVVSLKTGEAVLIPAIIQHIAINPKKSAKLLEVYLP